MDNNRNIQEAQERARREAQAIRREANQRFREARREHLNQTQAMRQGMRENSENRAKEARDNQR